MLPEAGIREEFNATIKSLGKMQREQEMEGILAKAAKQGLSQEERAYLQELITENHAIWDGKIGLFVLE